MAPSATQETAVPIVDTLETDQYSDGARIPKIHQYGDDPVTIRLSDEELSSGTTRPETIQALLTYFHRDGLVVLENAIPSHLIDSLYTRMVADNEIYLSNKFVQFNQGVATKNVSQVPPLSREFLLPEFYANVHAVAALNYLLGPNPELRFINSNVAGPGAAPTGRQAVHSDVNHTYPSIPFGIVLNTYLQDTDAHNGVTELWNGTHQAYPQKWQQRNTQSGRIAKEALQTRGSARPPVQPTVKKGSICFRDLRLWHAGMPNLSDENRIMLAVDYFAQWYGCPMTVKLPSWARESIERDWKGVSFKGVEWVEGEVEHLKQPFFLNMTQDPEMYVVHTEKGWEDWRSRKTGRYDFSGGDSGMSEQNYYVPE
jgi:hypothetical protein